MITTVLLLTMYVLSIVGLGFLVGLFDEAVNRRRPDDVCMCGDPMDKHGPYTGHVPVSMRDYYTDGRWR